MKNKRVKGNTEMPPIGAIVKVILLNTCGDEIELTDTAESFLWDAKKRGYNTFTVYQWSYADKGKV